LKNKTKNSTRAAVSRYDEKFERMTVRMPKGTIECIKSVTNESYNAYVNRLILEDLEKVQNTNIRKETCGEGEENE
jgi:hypothetical protein